MTVGNRGAWMAAGGIVLFPKHQPEQAEFVLCHCSCGSFGPGPTGSVLGVTRAPPAAALWGAGTQEMAQHCGRRRLAGWERLLPAGVCCEGLETSRHSLWLCASGRPSLPKAGGGLVGSARDWEPGDQGSSPASAAGLPSDFRQATCPLCASVSLLVTGGITDPHPLACLWGFSAI